MSEEALVAHRIVYDGVVNSGGLENVKVDKEMMKYVDKAHSQYLKNNLESNNFFSSFSVINIVFIFSGKV